MSAPSPDHPVRLVIVTGSGRSGTSTVAGTLKRLGLHIPQPEIPPDETNPRGFFESAWVVDFHKLLLNSIPARTNDARPGAAADVHEAAATEAMRDELLAWLTGQVAEVGPGGQLAVKDPRAFWAHDLWNGVAAELGLELSYLTMLRHPTEVVQSRETHYLSQQTDEFRRTRQTANLAGWVNSAFETEIATRDHPRAFVRYADLLADWRAAMSQAAKQTGLTFNADLGRDEHHAVDDFIDARLNRARVSWDETDTLPQLRDLASGSWDALNELVDSPYDPEAITALEEMRPQYHALHQYAAAIAMDHTSCSVVRERRAVQAKLRAAQGEKIDDLKQRLARRRQEVKQLRARLKRSDSTRKARLRRPRRPIWMRF